MNGKKYTDEELRYMERFSEFITEIYTEGDLTYFKMEDLSRKVIHDIVSAMEILG